MNITEKVIFEQFPYWEALLRSPRPAAPPAETTTIIGCGSSYNIALSLAASFNGAGRQAIAVPANEWLRRPGMYLADPSRCRVVALSRSGVTTEAVAAAQKSRSAGLPVTAITCAAEGELAAAADTVLCASTHPEEGIVMSVSACLMQILGLQFAGISLGRGIAAEAEAVMRRLDAEAERVVRDRSHFVYLGGGVLYGTAAEGGLKLQEMSQVVTQAYHPLEYRHGPVSLVGASTGIVMLYSEDTHEEEALLATELSAKGAFVVGLGGPGDIEIPVAATGPARPLAVMPALQILGERVAQARSLDTTRPRFLTKVVELS